MFAEEALDCMERAISDALAAGHHRLRVVHGKGMGILRREVREALKHHPQVRTFQYAPAHEGGEGVTVASLGSRY